ncbi:MAG: RNA polymerase sigma factor [Actinomycetota bacterium]|nr:RNA polymerase sigma factor [Actinomycetota bacterium]
MGDSSESVQLLWSRACAGDGEAFGRIFDAYRDRVYRHAYRLVDGANDAEDVTAIVFLELWRRRDVVRVVADSVLPWLLVTTGNVARNQRRSAFRYRRFLAALPRPDSALDAAASSAQSSVLGLDTDLRRTLDSLRGDDLHLLVLVSIEDYTIADAAAVLGLSEAAVKSRLHRIRARIRSQLATGNEFTTRAQP